MDTEQIKHWQELRHAYLKRLRVLELKEAQQGTDTPPHIIIETQELRDKIISTDLILQSMNTILDGAQKNTYVTQKTEGIQKVEIVIQGSFEQVTPEIQKAMVRALAAIMEISYEQVSVLNVACGSIILLISVPEQAAKKLHSLYNNHEPILDEIKVSSVKLIGDSTKRSGKRKYSSNRRNDTLTKSTKEAKNKRYRFSYRLSNKSRDSKAYSDGSGTISNAGHSERSEESRPGRFADAQRDIRDRAITQAVYSQINADGTTTTISLDSLSTETKMTHSFTNSSSINTEISVEERNWAMACHLSAMLICFFPYANIVAVFILWSMKRDTSAFVDDQGKEALNYNISIMIYITIAIIFSCFYVGIPILIGLVLFDFFIMITAGVNASNGKRYRYPITFRFIK